MFETDEERTYFSTTLFIHPYFAAAQSNEAINEAINLTEREQRILEYVQAHSKATIMEVAQVLGLNKSTVDRAVRSLKEKGILARQGPNRDRVWIILK